MGQYFKVVNIDKGEELISYDYDTLAKLMEHSYYGNPLINAVSRLLETDWDGDRVVWVGDYTEGEFDLYDKSYLGPEDPDFLKSPLEDDLYLDEDDNYTYDEIVDMRWGDYVLINYETKEYISLYSETDTYFAPVSNIPMMLATDNTSGGSYNGRNEDKVGLWAGAKVGLELKETADALGYTELKISFSG